MNMSTIISTHGVVTNFQKINADMGLTVMHRSISLTRRAYVYNRRTLRELLSKTGIHPLKNALLLVDPEYLDTPERDFVYEQNAKAEVMEETSDLVYSMVTESVASVKWKETGLILLVSAKI